MSLLLAFAPAPSAIDEPEPRFVRQYPPVQIDTPPVWGQFLLVLSEIDFKLVSIDSGFHFVLARSPLQQIRLQAREDEIVPQPAPPGAARRRLISVNLPTDVGPIT